MMITIGFSCLSGLAFTTTSKEALAAALSQGIEGVKAPPRLFAGNPAAVCPLDTSLPDGVMQAVARENNHGAAADASESERPRRLAVRGACHLALLYLQVSQLRQAAASDYGQHQGLFMARISGRLRQ